MIERKFHAPRPDDLAARTSGFPTRLENNRESGEARLLSVDFQPFRGFDRDAQSNIYAFGIELTPDSQEQIIERVATPLHEITQNNGIEIIAPGHGDLPPHVTFDAARFVGVSSSERHQLAQNLDHNLYFRMISNILGGLDFTMDTLVLGPSSYICTGDFNEQLYPMERSRRLIEKVFGKKGLETVDYRDIFHSSVARITAMPDRNNLPDFVEEAREKVGGPLKSDPIQISAERAFHSIAFDDIVKKGGKIAS